MKEVLEKKGKINEAEQRDFGRLDLEELGFGV